MSTILDIEQVEWKAVGDELPDCGTTVLIYALLSDEPVWLGYYDGTDWFAIGGEMYGNEDEIPERVMAWAPMPNGPNGDALQPPAKINERGTA